MKHWQFLAALALVGLSAHTHADERFPVLKRIGPAAHASLTQVLDWQRSFDDMPQAELLARLGPPDQTEDLDPNPVTQKPMRALLYRLTRRSEIRFVIHEGKVAATATTLVPSANEAGPIDD